MILMMEQKLAAIDVEEEEEEEEMGKPKWVALWIPLNWFRMLSEEMHWSLVFGVVAVYGISQGLGGALGRIGVKYYMKDVQQVEPSESQVFSAVTNLPWIVKPVWGILTDVLPIFGYSRRPYFILAGLLGVVSMLIISLHGKLHIILALLALTAGSAGVAIADVTVDACVAQKSRSHPSLAADMQSLCAFSSSIGALVGFSISGVVVHRLGPTGVFGVLAIPAALLVLVGTMLVEPRMPDFSYKQVCDKFVDAGKAMWVTLRSPYVWRPCLYMYLSFALSVDIQEGMFYWYTDSKDGPSFSQEDIGLIFSIGAAGGLLGALLYQNFLKDHPFRDLLFGSQLLLSLSGMLDLMLVLRLNLKLGLPDYLFIVVDGGVAQLIWQLKWMPLLVLSSKLCPSGIEGTFFALLMSIDNAGLLSSSWGGGLLLHVLHVSRTNFENLWLAVLIRNLLRLSPLCIIFLVPSGDPHTSIVPSEVLSGKEDTETQESKNLEMVPLVNNVSSRQCDVAQGN